LTKNHQCDTFSPAIIFPCDFNDMGRYPTVNDINARPSICFENHKIEVVMIGFKMDELMVGTHTFSDGSHKSKEYPLNFSLTWGSPDLLKFLNPSSEDFLSSRVKGFITVGGLANKADCNGTLKLMYFTKRKIHYELDFKGNNDRAYKYVGEKVNLWPWNLHKTHVTCYGTIKDIETGKIISNSLVHFPYRETLDFIMSARLVKT